MTDLEPIRDGARSAVCPCGTLYQWDLFVGQDEPTAVAPCCGSVLSVDREINWKATAEKYFAAYAALAQREAGDV